MTGKELLGLTGAILTFIAYIPYFIGLYRGTLKPHMFTWLLWSIMMTIVVAAQFTSGAGAGTWPDAIGAVLATIIFLSSLKYGEKNITRSDWVALTVGLSAIPLWVITKDPLWSVLLVTFIDATGYVPTFRKSWPRPYEESVSMFFINTITGLLGLAAVDIFIPTNYMYLVMCAVMNIALTIMLLYRRSVLGKTAVHAS